MNVQLPEINNGILPIVALALIAGFCIVALLVRSLLHSRIALLIAVVVGVVVAGPPLAFALAQIVGALVPLGIVIVIGGLAGAWLLQRNPELMSVVRDMMPRRSTVQISAPQNAKPIEQSRTMVIDQLPAPRQPVRRSVKRGSDDWGL